MPTTTANQPTVADVYNPIVAAARRGDPQGMELLRELGAKIFKANPGCCPSVEDGVLAARRNLDYYCQYFPSEVAAQVKGFYGLGGGFRDLAGNKHAAA